jgi:general secretion pathway protein J
MTVGSTRRPKGLRGFTLVEVLVVMTLLSVVMLALGASMRTIAQTGERVDIRLRQADEMRTAASFLSGVLGRISPRKLEPPPPAGANVYVFAAGPDKVEWIGVMPARYGAGGRHFFKLALEPNGTDRALVLRFQPWAEVATFPDWSNAASRVLATDVQRLTIEYGDDTEGQPSWAVHWPHVDRLPARVRLTIADAAGEWPFLTVPLRPLTASDSGRGGFSLGPEW